MLVDKLVEECTGTVKEVKLAKRSSTENENVCKYSSCTLHIVLFSIIFEINVGIDPYFVYYKYIMAIKKLVMKNVLIIKQHSIIDLIKWLHILKA